MQSYSLTRGLVIRRQARTYALIRQLEDTTLVFEDQLTGTPLSLNPLQLHEGLRSGRFALVTGNRPPDINSEKWIVDWATLPEGVRNDAERKLEFVRRIQRAGLTRGMRRQISLQLERIASDLGLLNVPRTSTVMSWLRRFELTGDDPAALITKNFRRYSPPRLDAKVLSIARRAIVNDYCSLSRPTLAKVGLNVEAELNSLVRAGDLPAEQAKVSQTTLRRLKNEIDPYQRDVSRYGAAFARNRWRYSLEGVAETRAMARYEVDHTLIDVVAVCDRTGLPLGRPWLTTVVDAYSGYPVGMFISFWGTGLGSTLAALKVAFFPKPDLTGIVALKSVWLSMGLPELIVIDNGLEFHSPHFRRMALHLGIDLLYCAVRQPWLKPVIERTFGSLLQHLPAQGRVRKHLPNESPVRPEDHAAITFTDLCAGLLTALVDIHPYEINQRKLSRPIDLFSESLAELPPPRLLATTDELDVLMAPMIRLTLGNEGVVMKYLRFNSRELQDLRRAIGLTFKAAVKFDPENLESVWVQSPLTHAWLSVPSCQPEYTRGLSLVQHRSIRAFAGAELKRRDAERILHDAKVRLANMWADRVKAGRRLKSAHLRALQGLTSTQLLAASGVQGETLKVPVEKLITESDLAPTVRDIPMFETFIL